MGVITARSDTMIVLIVAWNQDSRSTKLSIVDRSLASAEFAQNKILWYV